MSTETMSAADAFEQAYSKFFGPVRAYLAAQCGDWHLAEDLTQDAYAELWRMLSDGKDVADAANAYGLVRCIGKRMLGKHYGAMRNQRELLSGALPRRDGKTEVEQMADDAQPCPDLAEQAVTRVELGAAISALASGPRRAVGLRLVEDLTFVQAAEREGLHVDTVQNHFKQGLAHWLENIAKPKVRYNAYKAYAKAANNHLIPGIGGHLLDKVQPEHLEKLYAKMAASGLAPATVHQVHRTARTAFGVAFKRGHVKRNIMQLVDPPRLEEKEVEALTLIDMQRVIETALHRRNGVRFVVALALGLRQGEALGLEWSQFDEDRQTISLREQIQRQTWEHGCADPHACGDRLHKREACPVPCNRHTRPCPPPCSPDCAKHASSCPQRRNGGLVRAPVKSKAGRRSMGVPDTLFLLLLQHKEAQAQERAFAGSVWEEHNLMFCQPTGRPIDPRRDHTEWRSVLAETGVDEGRLHAARHSFATLLNELQVTDRAAQGVMGWSNASQAKRYQKMNDPVLRVIADKVEGALWGK